MGDRQCSCRIISGRDANPPAAFGGRFLAWITSVALAKSDAVKINTIVKITILLIRLRLINHQENGY